MAINGIVRRYILIIEKVSKGAYPSFEVLKSYLYDHGFEISDRTIERAIEQIRFDFGVDIIYDHYRNGYYIDTETSVNLSSFLRFVEVVHTAELFIESFKESKDTLNYVSFESDGGLRGVDILKPLLFAIKNYRHVSFVHENFDTGRQNEYHVKPYLLKEYQNRWYLVGMVAGLKEFRTFGIDRIHQLEVKTETFKPDVKNHPIHLFENIVGLSYSYNSLEDVILSFTPFQAKYVKTLPLHKSQEIILENEEEVKIRLRIIPNFEFKQKILMLGENVRVVSPAWLVEEIKESLQNSLKYYE